MGCSCGGRMGAHYFGCPNIPKPYRQYISPERRKELEQKPSHKAEPHGKLTCHDTEALLAKSYKSYDELENKFQRLKKAIIKHYNSEECHPACDPKVLRKDLEDMGIDLRA